MTRDTERVVLVERLATDVEEHRLWRSPFLDACRENQVARRDFHLLFSGYADHVRGLDQCIASVAANCGDPRLRAELMAAAWGGDRPWIARRAAAFDALLRGVGLDPEALAPSAAGAQLAKDHARLCSGDPVEGAAVLGYAVLEAAKRIGEAIAPGLTALGIDDESISFVTMSSAALDAALRRIVSSSTDGGRDDRIRAAVSSALATHDRFLTDTFQGMLRLGVNTILERIQQRKSLATPGETFLHTHGTPGSLLYSNKIDKHTIEFTVESLPFRPEVLEPRIVRIPPRKNNEKHRHAHETVFISLEGEGEVLVGDEVVPMKPGDIVFVPRWAMHQTRNTGDREMRTLAITDFNLTGKTFIGDYTKTSRMVKHEQSANPNWRALRAESKLTEDYLAPLSIAYGGEREWPEPYPLYERARVNAPIYYSERFGAWFLTRYDDVAAALRDPRLSSKRADEKFRGLDESVRVRMDAFRDSMRQWMSFMDPPDHTRIRGRLNRFFSGPAVEAMRPRIERVVNELMDHVAPTGRADVIWDLASPLHCAVVAEMLFSERVDPMEMKRWSMDMWSFIGSGAPTAQRAELAAKSWSEMHQWVREHVEIRRQAPKDDVVSALFATNDSGDALTLEEVTANCVLLLSIGHEATWDTIANCVLTVLRHPEAMAELRESPTRMPAAVDELLRFESPVQFVARRATEAFLLKDKQIEKNDFFFLMIGSANRDPEQFPYPDRLDFHRANNRNLATGGGIHHCIGGPLGKLETQVVLHRLLARWPRMRLTGDKLPWKQSLGSRGVHTLPILL